QSEEERLLWVRELAGGLRRGRDTAPRARPGTAPGLDAPDAQTALTGNEILGAGSPSGGPGGAEVGAGELAQLAAKTKKGAVQLAESSGALQVTDNRFTRLALSADVLGRLRELTPGNRAGEIAGVCRTGFFTANLFEAGANHWLARHLGLTANSFE